MTECEAAVRTIRVNVIREPACVSMSPRMRQVCWDFGIPPREQPRPIAEGLELTLKPGTIVLITGPSGSGKSSILSEIAAQAEPVSWVGNGRFARGRAMVDAIAPRRPLSTALEILTACGLGEPRLWVRQYEDLSDGERFRASLARAVGQALGRASPGPILCDEFSAILHRRLAKCVAYTLRKLVSRTGLILVAATTHEDIAADLQPDVHVRLEPAGPRPIEKPTRPRPVSLNRSVRIEPGSVRDYALFSSMHYRHRDGLGFVDKVFLLRESAGGQPIGILVFAHAPMELTQRNRSTNGRFIRNLRRLNRELRILRRLVMHPDVRGCGLGHWFVRRTLPMVGVRFVECLAAMGAINPVFEKAGLTRVGRCPMPRGRIALLNRMKQWNVDPFAPNFERRIAHCPRVRVLVEDTIRRWVAATQGGIKYRVDDRAPLELVRVFRQLLGSPPVYYLWDRRGVYPKPVGDASEDTRAGARRSEPSRRRPESNDVQIAESARKERSADSARRGDRPSRHDPAEPPATRRGALRRGSRHSER